MSLHKLANPTTQAVCPGTSLLIPGTTITGSRHLSAIIKSINVVRNNMKWCLAWFIRPKHSLHESRHRSDNAGNCLCKSESIALPSSHTSTPLQMSIAAEASTCCCTSVFFAVVIVTRFIRINDTITNLVRWGTTSQDRQRLQITFNRRGVKSNVKGSGCPSAASCIVPWKVKLSGPTQA